MQTQGMTIRLQKNEWEKIKEIAAKNKVKQTDIARMFIRDGLAQFDRKHIALMEKIMSLQMQIATLQESSEQSNILSAANLAAISLLNIDRIDGARENGRGRLKENVKTSLRLGKSLQEARASGAFDKET
ncbi:MAG: hypothetical protein HHJ09_12765 [Glaciimonas sp.]|nr:hypothetical protein [Glaciimonas sp.]